MNIHNAPNDIPNEWIKLGSKDTRENLIGYNFV